MPRRDERGQAAVLIIGLATVLAMTIALVVDATAAYLQRQGLDTLADGAALRGADLGASGRDVYEGGVPDDRLELTAAQARQAVGAYLRSTGAYSRYPGLTYRVRVDPATRSVEVSLRAPLDLPLTVPGSPEVAMVGATGSAVVGVDATPAQGAERTAPPTRTGHKSRPVPQPGQRTFPPAMITR